MRSLLFAGLVLVLYGCTHTAHSTTTRLIPNMGACPDAGEMEDLEDVDDAERTEWHRVDLSPLCYYRITFPASDTSELDQCPYPHARVRPQTLDQMRSAMLAEPGLGPDLTTGTAPAPTRWTECTDDYGSILILVSPTPDACPAAPTSVSYEIGDLIATDTRTPYRWCKYELTYQEEDSCGTFPMPMQ